MELVTCRLALVQDLVAQGMLLRTGERRYTRYGLNCLIRARGTEGHDRGLRNSLTSMCRW